MLLSSNESLMNVTRELMDTRLALAKAEQERDQAVSMANKSLAETASLLTRLSGTPLGRRAVVTDTISKFESMKSVYSEAFMDLLTRKD